MIQVEGNISHLSKIGTRTILSLTAVRSVAIIRDCMAKAGFYPYIYIKALDVLLLICE